MNEVCDKWCSGIQSWWHAARDWCEPVYGRFFFVRNPVNAVTNFHRLKPQILQIHRFQRTQR